MAKGGELARRPFLNDCLNVSLDKSFEAYENVNL